MGVKSFVPDPAAAELQDLDMWQGTVARLAQEAAEALSPSAMAAAGIKDPRYYVKVRGLGVGWGYGSRMLDI